jgi:predicted RNase H-like HicB family nuclease
MKIHVHIDYFEEDGVIVALCPELQVSSFGDTLTEAEQSIREALELFFEGCEAMGTLDEILEESGYTKIADNWRLRKPVKTTETPFHWKERAKSYA